MVCLDHAVDPIDGAIPDDGTPPGDTTATADGPGSDAPQTAAWTLIQTKDRSMSSTISFPATGAHHLLVVGIEAETPVTSVTDNAGNVYDRIATSRAEVPVPGLGVEMWFVADSVAGATTITAASANGIDALDLWEVGGLPSPTVDAVATLDDQPATTSPAGAEITTSSAGEFVVSIVIVKDRVNSIQNGGAFTMDHMTFFNGWAHLTDAMAPAGTYQAQWSSTSGSYCASTVAFRRN